MEIIGIKCVLDQIEGFGALNATQTKTLAIFVVAFSKNSGLTVQRVPNFYPFFLLFEYCFQAVYLKENSSCFHYAEKVLVFCFVSHRNLFTKAIHLSYNTSYADNVYNSLFSLFFFICLFVYSISISLFVYRSMTIFNQKGAIFSLV